ncbi:hypothetical protein NLI96_g9514 [Meripilus lineatus]|uniref:Uncharacterized protein n=1 Tax=Meripilus lineatus TaxID=2056292 RepID=A0AAD5UXK3_9APHY|nr:hypothetical protein NLI96_g9514 [Physisporinus lineatus]
MATPIPSPITPASRMPDPPTGGPEPQWRVELREKIEKELKSMVDKARQEKDEKLRSLPRDDATERERVEGDFEATMKTLRRLAGEQFREAVREKQVERQLARSGNVERTWSDSLIKEQQAILDEIQRTRKQSGPDSEGRPSVESPVLPQVPETTSSYPQGNENDNGPRISRPSERDLQPRTPSRGPTRPPSTTRPSFGISRYPTSPVISTASAHSPPKSSNYITASESYPDRPQSGMGVVNRRTSTSSLSSNKAGREVWIPGSSPNDPIVSRTTGYAASPPPSVIPSLSLISRVHPLLVPPMRNGTPAIINLSSPPPPPQSSAPLPTRSGLTTSAPQRPSPPAPFVLPQAVTPPTSNFPNQYRWPFEEDMHSPEQEKAERDSLEQRRGSRSKPRDIPPNVNVWDVQRSTGIRHRSSASDFHSRAWDSRTTQSPIPISPPISPDYTRSPDPSRPSPTNIAGDSNRRPEGEERGIPIPSRSRPYRPSQGSPEFSRNFPPNFGSGRSSIPRKASLNSLEDGIYPFQMSPGSARSNNWTVSNSPVALRRQESTGSQRSARSIRSHNSRQDLYSHGDTDNYGRPPMETYEEQSDSDYGSGSYDEWEDSAWDVEGLWKRREEAFRKEEEQRGSTEAGGGGYEEGRRSCKEGGGSQTQGGGGQVASGGGKAKGRGSEA